MTVDQTTDLLALALAAFLAPLVSRHIGIPAAVGEIICGALLGIVIGPVEPSGLPSALGFVGFALLMFTAGNEIDFDEIERGGVRQVLIAAVYVGIVLGGALALGHWAGLAPVFSLAFGVMSIGIAAAVLREDRIVDGPIGQMVLLVGGLGEFASMIALTLLNLASKNGLGLRLVLDLGRLLLALLAVYAILTALRTLVWWFPEQFERLVDTDDPSEVGVRTALALMLAFVAAAGLLGIEPILGAFLAGAIFGFVFRGKETLERKLFGIGYGFLIPIFFIGVGQSLQPAALATPGVITIALGVLAATLFLRLVPVALIRLTGLPWSDTLAMALLLAAPLTLQVAVAQVGQDLKILSVTQATALTLAAVIGGVVAPVAARLVRGEAGPVWPRPRNAG